MRAAVKITNIASMPDWNTFRRSFILRELILLLTEEISPQVGVCEGYWRQSLV